MRQENRFVQVARSGVARLGLDAADAERRALGCRQAGDQTLQRGMVNEIGTNVQLGTHYLKTVQTRWADYRCWPPRRTTSAPAAARAWQAVMPLEGPFMPRPSRSTKPRLREKVMANAVHYAKVFNHEGPPLKTRLGTISRPQRTRPGSRRHSLIQHGSASSSAARERAGRTAGSGRHIRHSKRSRSKPQPPPLLA